MPLAALTLALLLVFGLDLFLTFPVGASVLYIPLPVLAARIGSARLAWCCCGASVVLAVIAVAAIRPSGVADVESVIVARLAVASVLVAVTWLTIGASQSNATAPAAEAVALRDRDFRDLAENLPDVVARFDRQLRHVYVNRAVQRYTGMPPEMFLGKDHVQLGSPPELTTKSQGQIRSVFETGQPSSFEFTYVAPEGVRHFECRLVAELAADGGVETVLGINRDVTEMHRAQEQAKLHLEQLAHAGRLSTIGSLVSEVAHEINQPLHAISNYANACLNMLDKLAIDRKSNLALWLRQISDQAQRAAEIIRRSSRFARKSPMQRSTVEINNLISDCLRLVNFDLRAHRVKLRCEFGHNLPPLIVDSVQVLQVLVNLLRNAIDAMRETPEADRRLLVRSEMAGQYVQISVRDNGAGIRVEQSEKLFEPFFTTKREGLGMGLAVSQAIAEAHSGKLWAEPNHDRGVTFYFALPAGKEEMLHEYSHV